MEQVPNIVDDTEVEADVHRIRSSGVCGEASFATMDINCKQRPLDGSCNGGVYDAKGTYLTNSKCASSFQNVDMGGGVVWTCRVAQRAHNSAKHVPLMDSATQGSYA